MIPSARGLFAEIQGAVARHRTAAVSVLCGCVLLGALAVVVWPGAALPVIAVTAVAALILTAAIPRLIDRRNPYFRDREDVEETLNLSVLAVYSERGRR